MAHNQAQCRAYKAVCALSLGLGVVFASLSLDSLSLDSATSAGRNLRLRTTQQQRLDGYEDEVDRGVTAAAPREPTPPPGVPGEVVDMAVCVVGAARSFAEPEVIQSFRAIAFPANTRFFQHLYVGTELSAKGQQALGPDDADAMAGALSGTTTFQFQYQENDFTCGQQTTGKYHKLSACARMVDKYVKRTGVAFRSIVFVRPDLMWDCPTIPPYHATTNIFKALKTNDWHIKSNNEVIAISGSETSRNVAMGLTEAHCCDEVFRKPAECFIDGLREPSAAFIQDRHFTSNLCDVRTDWMHTAGINNFVGKKECRVMIKRTGYQNEHGNDSSKTMKALHEKLCGDVVRCVDPQTSPVMTSFGSLQLEQQRELVRQLLSVHVGTECAITVV